MKFSIVASAIAAALIGVHASPAPEGPRTIARRDSPGSQQADMESLVRKADDLASSAAADQAEQIASLNSAADIGEEATVVVSSSLTQGDGNVVVVTEVVTVTAGAEEEGASNDDVQESGDSEADGSEADAADGTAESAANRGENLGESAGDSAGSPAEGTLENQASASSEEEAAAPNDTAQAEQDTSGAAEENTPAEESTSAEEATPAEEATSAEEATPAEESTSAEVATPAEEATASQEASSPAEEYSTDVPSSSGGGGSGGGGGGSSGETFSGDGTYYTPGLGSCGKTNTDSDLIAAINAPQYGTNANPNQAEVCGKCALVKGPKGEVKVTITDRCPVCKSGDLDLSPSAFEQIGEFDDGRQSGLGRRTFLNTLCEREVIPPSEPSSPDTANVADPMKFDTYEVNLEEEGTRISLKVIDAAGFGDALDNRDCFKQLQDYIEAQFDEVLVEESRVKRNRRYRDHRLH
ncbi:hypothetical protein GGF43_003585, partial [Coemansia sp. RSA 2618]